MTLAGDKLASCGMDNVVKLWPLTTDKLAAFIERASHFSLVSAAHTAR